MNPFTNVFHPGELHAQRAAGTSAAAAQLSSMLADDLSPYPFAVAFFATLQHVWLTARASSDSALWVTPLFGAPSFVKVTSRSTVRIRPAPRVGEHAPLGLRVRVGEAVGLLGLDPATRQRFRVNGVVAAVRNQPYTLDIAVTEAFPNCPKYIYRRRAHSLKLDAAGRDKITAQQPEEDTALSPTDRALVAAADTFILGTAAHGRADTSHRGGRPGFVRLRGDALLWPDYAGNGLFQSLGNLHADGSAAAVTFLCPRSGKLLQLSGAARVVERGDDPSGLLDGVEPSAKRGVLLTVAAVRRWTAPVTSLRWTDVEPSHYNPPVTLPTGQCNANGVQKCAANHTNQPESCDANGRFSPASVFPLQAKLVKIVEETSNIKTFYFRADAAVPFRPGQYATFEFHGVDVGTAEPVERTWTLSGIAGTDGRSATLEVSVKRKAGGLMSTFLHDRAKIGLRATVRGVDGDMTPFTTADTLDARSTRHGERFCLISAGVGVTPNVAILRGLTARNALSDVAFVYQGRGAELPFRAELLRRSADSLGGVQVLQMVTGAKAALATDGLSTGRGRLDVARIKKFVPDIAQRLVFLCGPPGFMASVAKALVELGVERDAVISENFDF